MRRWFLLAPLVLLLAPRLDACEVSWGRRLQNPTVYSANHRFAAIFRVHEKIPDFRRRRSSLVLRDPIPRWDSVPLAIYDRRKKISEFPVDFKFVNDVLVSDSGQFVAGLLTTKNYPCPAPPRWADDQIVTIYRIDGTLTGVVKLRQAVPESALNDDRLIGPPLDYLLRTEEDGQEVLLITHGDETRRVPLASGVVTR